MKNFKSLNNIAGWATFAIATLVYFLTIEPTASYWDCGEYISSAFKLEVGHPPGAPLFLIIGKFFSLFASDLTTVAKMINRMSALCSGFTILFLFWTITMLAKKLIKKPELEDYSLSQTITILGAAFIGSMAYTFTDSFWFSAVEGEVYAMSSFFTALVFWAILKWEAVANEKHSLKWLVLIAYLIGLSIGVHLLNLLAIPAIVFVYYFSKYKKTSVKGIIITFIISIILLGFIQAILIPWIVKLAGLFELFFVNSIGLPFNAGTIIYFVLLIGGLTAGILYSIKKQKVILNTLLICLTMLIIGYSSFFILIIRSNADTPINENKPKDAISLLSYLNREQYGDWPILYGQNYNAHVVDYKNGNPVYRKDCAKGKYIVIDKRENTIPVYDAEHCSIFPRMWSSEQQHVIAYRKWADVRGVMNKPITLTDNLTFFLKYQVGYMYGRYFMWNFVGKQNDLQGMGYAAIEDETTEARDILKGNWLSGIDFIDAMRLGPQSYLPSTFENNKARNKFYFLPLILGLLGIVYQFKKDKKNAIIVLLLHIMTGLAIVVYLNQYPFQPRERDYAYAGAFYAFAIWIGLGVFAIAAILKKYFSPNIACTLAVILSLPIPTLLAVQGWDDHDRSDRYTARDIAKDYLDSCDPNAILFTNGDNDTFPLWYVQEVENYRTDIRVVNLSLLATDWYINEMKKQAYNSAPLPISLTEDKYIQGNRDILPIEPVTDSTEFADLKSIISFVSNDKNKAKMSNGSEMNYFPTSQFNIPVKKANLVASKQFPAKDTSLLFASLPFRINQNFILKNNLIVLDLLANNEWKRPIYFAITGGSSVYMGLERYFQLEGLAFHLLPKNCTALDNQEGSINTTILYDKLMNKYKWGGIDNPKVYLDENNIRMVMNFRSIFSRLAMQLIMEKKADSAHKVLDRCLKIMPDKCIPFDYSVLLLAKAYYSLGDFYQGNQLIEKLLSNTGRELSYFDAMPTEYKVSVEDDKRFRMAIIYQIYQLVKQTNQDKLIKDIEAKYAYFINS